jgi:hypothetical protein
MYMVKYIFTLLLHMWNVFKLVYVPHYQKLIKNEVNVLVIRNEFMMLHHCIIYETETNTSIFDCQQRFLLQVLMYYFLCTGKLFSLSQFYMEKV